MCTDLITILTAIAAHGDNLTVNLMSDALIILQHNVTGVITAWNFDANSGLFCASPSVSG